MNFDVLSFILGKLNCGSNFNDVVSYLLGKALSAIWKTITNVAIASFTAVSDILQALVVDITLRQSGSGEPSPANVRPISGWTGANIFVSPTLDAQDGTIYSVSWQSEAGTVYGGTLTDNGDGTWTLVITMAGVDMGTMTWGASSQSGCFYTNSVNDYKNVNNMVFYCSQYKPDGHGSIGDLYGIDNTIRYFLSESSGRAFNVHDNAQAGKTGEQFASAVSGVILVYELASPAPPITLTAESARALIGQNNLWADTGNINTITYRER